MDFFTSSAAAPRPGTARPRDFDANMQAIASAAHLRGVVLTKGSEVKGSVEAGELCKTLRLAHEKTRGNRGKFDHVKRMANAIAAGLGVRGAVVVSQAAWNLIRGYANPRPREE